MATNNVLSYDVDPHYAEFYDRFENYRNDVDLIEHLILHKANMRILAPFCETDSVDIPNRIILFSRKVLLIKPDGDTDRQPFTNEPEKAIFIAQKSC